MARSNYTTFDFTQFNEKGLKDVIKQFKKNDLIVNQVEADNKPKRQSGVQVKKAVLTFEDGQALTLQATAQGSIFQVRLNTRVIPVKHVDDLNKAIAEISQKVKANATAFQKTLKRRQTRIKNTDSKSAAARVSSKAQLQQYQDQINVFQESNQTLLTQQTELQQQFESKTQLSQSLQAQLQAEQEKHKQLDAELTRLLQEQVA